MNTRRDRRETLGLLYGGLLALCLLLGTKVIDLGPLAFDGSQLPYALILCIIAIVTEVDGRAAAKSIILKGLAFQAIAFSMITLTLSLPASESMEPMRAEAFQTLVGQNLRMIVAGVISYLTVTYLISRIQDVMSKAHFMTLGRRSAIANICGQAADTLIYLSIAFYAIFPLGPLMAGQFTVKAMIGILIVPIFVRFGTSWYAGKGELDPAYQGSPRP